MLDIPDKVCLELLCLIIAVVGVSLGGWGADSPDCGGRLGGRLVQKLEEGGSECSALHKTRRQG